MPKAGFYAIESGRISFRRDGHWYTDNERIDNSAISLLFSRSIRRNPDGTWLLQVGDERASIDVEDTPYVVKGVEPDGIGSFKILLNDGEQEPLNFRSLDIGRDNVLYCDVKAGHFRARFLRPAYYQLSQCLEQDSAGNLFFRVGSKKYPIAAAARQENARSD